MTNAAYTSPLSYLSMELINNINLKENAKFPFDNPSIV